MPSRPGIAGALRGALGAADSALRVPTREAKEPRWSSLVLAIVLLTPIYGFAMGSYGFSDPDRRLVALYAAIKTPFLLLLTTALCLAPYLVLGLAAQMRDSMGAALRAILAGQACASAVLAAAAPVTLMVYTAIHSHDYAVLYNAGVFGLAALLGHRATMQRFRPLVAADRRHLPLLWFWCVLYCFVGVQMGWSLRPFIGDPSTTSQFFREDSMTNAYLAVLRYVNGALGR